MKFSRFELFCSATALSLAASQSAYAAVTISNLTFDNYRTDGSGIATSLSFDLIGTIKDVTDENTQSTTTLFIGQAGNSAWFNGAEFQYKFVMGNWSATSGTLNITSALVNQNATFGDYIVLSNNDAIVAGDTIDGRFTVTNASFNPLDAFPHDWIVSVGYSPGATTLPDALTATGSAVPEPNSLGLFVIGACGIALRRRRRV